MKTRTEERQDGGGVVMGKKRACLGDGEGGVVGFGAPIPFSLTETMSYCSELPWRKKGVDSRSSVMLAGGLPPVTTGHARGQ